MIRQLTIKVLWDKILQRKEIVLDETAARSCSDVDIIERAFQLAPECGTVAEIARRLACEGYLNIQSHLAGKFIRTQLYGRLNSDLKRAARTTATQVIAGF